MNTRNLNNDEFAAHMRRKRSKDDPDLSRWDVHRKDFGDGISLAIKCDKTPSKMFVSSDMYMWGIHIRVPRSHPWYGQQVGGLLFGEDFDAVGRMDYQHEIETNRYLISTVYTGSAKAVKEMVYAAAKRAVDVISKPKTDGIATKAT